MRRFITYGKAYIITWVPFVSADWYTGYELYDIKDSKLHLLRISSVKVAGFDYSMTSSYSEFPQDRGFHFGSISNSCLDKIMGIMGY